MKKRIFQIGLTIGIICFIWFLFYFFREFHTIHLFSVLREGAWYYILGAALASIGMVMGTGILIAEVFRLYGASCRGSEGVSMWVASIALGPATAGLSLPILLFSKAKQKTSSHITSLAITGSVFLFYFLPIFLSMFFLLLSTPIRITLLHEFRTALLFSGLALIGILILILFRKKIKQTVIALSVSWFGASEKDLHDAFLQIRALSWKKIVRTFLVSCVALAFNFVILLFSLYALHEHMHFVNAFSNFIMSELIIIIAPSAGGLGFVELSLAGLLGASGLSTASALTVTLIFRIFNFWLPTLVGVMYVLLKGYTSFLPKES